MQDGGGLSAAILLRGRRSNNVCLHRLIAAEMGKIHCIVPDGGPAEPFIWTKMSHFLTLLQKSRNMCPEQRRPDR